MIKSYNDGFMGGIIGRAKDYATNAHRGQTRTDGSDFINHPAQTAQILKQITDDPNLIAAGWLHDTIEDCEWITHETIRDEFNEDIADLVQAVTYSGHYNTFPGLKDNRRAVLLKFADRLSNLSDMAGWNDKKRSKYILKSMFWNEGDEDEQS